VKHQELRCIIEEKKQSAVEHHVVSEFSHVMSEFSLEYHVVSECDCLPVKEIPARGRHM
jgi:hypothetical protein